MGWGKEPQPTILFLCDVIVAAGGHVDFKSTHYYSGNLNLLEASGPVQACNGIDFFFWLIIHNTATINRGKILFRVSLHVVVCNGDRNGIRDSTIDTRYMQTEGLHQSRAKRQILIRFSGIHVPAFDKQLAT